MEADLIAINPSVSNPQQNPNEEGKAQREKSKHIWRSQSRILLVASAMEAPFKLYLRTIAVAEDVSLADTRAGKSFQLPPLELKSNVWATGMVEVAGSPA